MGKPRKFSKDVGYKRPPSANQFKPGQSGNPKGRPKSKLSLLEIIERELNQPVPVSEGGKRKKMSALVLMIKQQIKSAAQGNIRSAAFLLKQLGVNSPERLLEKSKELDGPDELVMESIIRRIRAMDSPAPADENANPEQ